MDVEERKASEVQVASFSPAIFIILRRKDLVFKLATCAPVGHQKHLPEVCAAESEVVCHASEMTLLPAVFYIGI